MPVSSLFVLFLSQLFYPLFKLIFITLWFLWLSFRCLVVIIMVVVVFFFRSSLIFGWEIEFYVILVYSLIIHTYIVIFVFPDFISKLFIKCLLLLSLLLVFYFLFICLFSLFFFIEFNLGSGFVSCENRLYIEIVALSFCALDAHKIDVIFLSNTKKNIENGTHQINEFAHEFCCCCFFVFSRSIHNCQKRNPWFENYGKN